ncbi:MAG: FKBP-type peptidyl-prolyl cis-trans isomerase [Flavobacteriia bacterium]|nr:FKBP-type peptidyl-prolyl cis-trans isomerase [Flavobacteriia bacterium]
MEKNKIEIASYGIGLSIADSLFQQNFDKLDSKMIGQAIEDAFNKNEYRFSPQEAHQYIQEYLQEINGSQFAQNKESGENFLNENKNKSGINTTNSGLQYEVLNEGTGPKPHGQQMVRVHYHGTLLDGTVFDSSYERGEPAVFGVHQVIPGWTEALQLMYVGSKYRLFIPQELAYGSNPHPNGPIEPFMALQFDVELLEVL